MNLLKKMPIHHRLLVSYSLVLILSISAGSSFIYYFVREKLIAGTESELLNTTTAIRNMVKTSAGISIRNHLRAVAEKNLEIIGHLNDQAVQGVLAPLEARQMAIRLLLAQTIGDSGYIYCLDRHGKVVVHPQTSLVGTDVSEFDFVREQLAEKSGYLEYEWKNPDEPAPRPKALYMLYFEPWDWILSVSSYRNEFNRLVNIEDFEKIVLQMRFGNTGYAFVTDGKGAAVIHPKANGMAPFLTGALHHRQLEEMLRLQSGKMADAWNNPDEAAPGPKLMFFNYLPEYDWIVISSVYLEEFFGPMRTIRNSIIATAMATFLLVLPLSLRISASITNPLRKLIHNFERMIAGDFSSRMIPDSNDEIGRLAVYYNRFADQVENYRNNLRTQRDHRIRVEEALRESEARYRSVMEAAPDPIVVYDMQGRVSYLNPAFTRIFGWSLDACRGQRMDHFVPEENWEETNRMIRTVLSGETLSSVPTRRYTRSGQIIDVSISGATFRNRNGKLVGSIIILRDVTKSRILQMQVMEISDQVHRRISRDLHDDLCPHLIGIQGLSTVLAGNLRETAPDNLHLADQVVELIGDAIGKARSLARGLCPVHLVAHGLSAALENLAAHTEAAFTLPCRFEEDGPVVLTDNTVATHLFYIAQEAVQNAVKHARANRITIALGRRDTILHLRIADNGIGIPEKLTSGGIGLQIMRYRATIIHAAFEIDSAPDTGTTIRVVLKAAAPTDHRPLDP